MLHPITAFPPPVQTFLSFPANCNLCILLPPNSKINSAGKPLSILQCCLEERGNELCIHLNSVSDKTGQHLLDNETRQKAFSWCSYWSILVMSGPSMRPTETVASSSRLNIHIHQPTCLSWGFAQTIHQ